MQANILSIPPGRPFLKTLAESLFTGRIVPSFRYEGDPLALADVTLYVPTRRAARGLASAFTELLGGRSAILPAIRPLGETDDSALLSPGEVQPSLAPTIGELERQLHLARLAREWRFMVRKAEAEALIGGEAVLPASAADALWLAGDLGRLLDEIETEGTSFAAIAGLAPDDLAHWWQLTLTFLKIVTEQWPAILTARGVVGEAEARNAWLAGEAERLRSGRRKGPVILAGSTATAPATLELMHTIAYLDDGALVLPGLDRHLEPEAFAKIDRERSIAAPGHPQYGLKRILTRFQRGPETVEHLGDPEEGALAAREAFLSDALRPAETTDAWGASQRRHPPEALDGLALIEAADDREEALAVACAMRAALSDPGRTAALITPDRNLARRVVSELERFGIGANDSAGRPLGATAPGTLMATAIKVALEPGDPIALVSLLKHPLTRLGLGAGEARRAARAIEMVALRGSVGVADGADMAGIFARRRKAIDAGERVARPVRNLPEAERDLGQLMAEALERALAPLTRLRPEGPSGDRRGGGGDGLAAGREEASGEVAGEGPSEASGAGAAEAADAARASVDLRSAGSGPFGEREIADYAVALTQVLEALAADETGDAENLYAEEAGKALASFLSDLVQAPQTGFAFAPREFGDVVEALVAGVTVQPRAGLSARAFVWGALEARLQSVDTAILAGLNEGVWPGGAKSGAFLSRLMRREIALDPPERRIGLAAHDFWMATGAPHVVLSRSRRSGGSPTIASRWLQRLTTLARRDGTARLVANGAVYLDAARALDRVEPQPRAARPQPRPPVERRPTHYSVTEVETLIRDPYAIHARRILKLEPLPELMRDPHAAERGSLFHDVLGTFVKQGHDPVAGGALETILAIARDKFAAENLPPDIAAIWWPRMEALAQNYLDWEAERHDRVALRHAEIAGHHDFAELATTLTGRADRIDVLTDGRVEILDYKTGAQPSLSQARALLAPQLPLEGAMVKLGAFADVAPASEKSAGKAWEIADLVYVRLRERTLYEDRFASAGGRSGESVDPDALSEEALKKFRGLVATYRQEQAAFVSRTRPFLAGDFSGDYDHLARAEEWSVGADETSGGEGAA
ncbi:double-strand break repair protein AddB [Jiella sp. M17.18]|uniref:double-strand break repair protein AddB n=1 Tax=Jiella sp. M17.18 TaxID=3234247 RepID=UPI0034E043A9